MLNSTWREKHLNLGAGAGGQDKIIMIVLGVVVIGILVGLGLWIFGGGGGTDGGSDKIMYKCMDPDCGHEWEPSKEEYEAALGDSKVPPWLDCPQCGKEKIAGREDQCPKCDKWYPSPMMTPGGGGSDTICPHCGANISEIGRNDPNRYK